MTKNEHIYAICCRPEVDGDCGNVKTIEGYVVLNFEAASISSSWENENQPFEYVDDGRPTWAPFSESRSKNV